MNLLKFGKMQVSLNLEAEYLIRGGGVSLNLEAEYLIRGGGGFFVIKLSLYFFFFDSQLKRTIFFRPYQSK